MKNILIAVVDYPDNEGKVTLMYVHTRNQYYKELGYKITVLNFSSKKDYKIDGINVIGYKTYLITKKEYDILILHAPNLKNHYIFLKKFNNNFKRLIFFFHGHEVLRINNVYSKPYWFQRQNLLKNYSQDVYDTLKLYLWKKYLFKLKEKSDFIFVSKWMLDKFKSNLKIDLKRLEYENNIHITYNGIGKIFESYCYDETIKKEFDFVTVRANLDGSKYAIDIVIRLAKNTPNSKFLIVGKGNFFNYYEKPDNVIWYNRTLKHNQILDILNHSKFALMPTRTDAQGLMMCEMAAFGIPIITSDIPICHEVFDNFSNVWFINNNDLNLSLNSFKKIKNSAIKDNRFYFKNTIKKEIEIFNQRRN